MMQINVLFFIYFENGAEIGLKHLYYYSLLNIIQNVLRLHCFFLVYSIIFPLFIASSSK